MQVASGHAADLLFGDVTEAVGNEDLSIKEDDPVMNAAADPYMSDSQMWTDDFVHEQLQGMAEIGSAEV